VDNTVVDDILKERGREYGSFREHAEISQALKFTLHNSHNWNKLTWDKKEALEMIAHKIARILNGNPCYRDSWIDICGYSKLVSDTLEDL